MAELYTNWTQSNIQSFWSEVAPCQHILQIYENEKVFLETLEGFVGSGILAGDAVIVIATPEHLEGLEKRLLKHTIHLDSAKSNNQFIPIDAHEMLAKFMVNGQPDRNLFMEAVNAVMAKAKSGGRSVRAFGEMVAILWEEGNNAATLDLENLWNSFSEKEKFSLFCAYPKSGFAVDTLETIHTICKTHSHMLGGWPKPSTEVFYKSA